MPNFETALANQRQRVKLSDIAEETGFSLTTVSKALNGRSDISTSTRKQIETVLEERGYTRRAAKHKTHGTIEIVFQNFDSLWSFEVLRGFLQKTKAQKISLTVTESGNRQHPDSSWIKGIMERQPMGVVLIFSNLTDTERDILQLRKIPFVVFDPSGNPAQDGLSVQADNWRGGLIATRHLLALNHKRIGIITGPDEMMCSRARLDGYSTALAEQGIQKEAELITEGDFTTAGGYAQAMALLEDPRVRPSAIFAGSDLQAMGVYEAARQLRVRIPEDLSVVGFDDVQTASYMGPALTTVRQPLQDMAAVAAQMLIDTSENKPIQRQVIMPTTLIVRNSTRQLNEQ